MKLFHVTYSSLSAWTTWLSQKKSASISAAGNTGSEGARQRAPHNRNEKVRPMKTPIDRAIAVTATDRVSMERQLDEAVAIARTWAMEEGCQGILVTRHDFDSFSVALSDAVPFGLTREHQDW